MTYVNHVLDGPAPLTPDADDGTLYALLRHFYFRAVVAHTGREEDDPEHALVEELVCLQALSYLSAALILKVNELADAIKEPFRSALVPPVQPALRAVQVERSRTTTGPLTPVA